MGQEATEASSVAVYKQDRSSYHLYRLHIGEECGSVARIDGSDLPIWNKPGDSSHRVHNLIQRSYLVNRAPHSALTHFGQYEAGL
jgi:hypothetical protein